MSLVDESFEFNSFLGGEFVTVESESTTKIENTKNMRFSYVLGKNLCFVVNALGRNTLTVKI